MGVVTSTNPPAEEAMSDFSANPENLLAQSWEWVPDSYISGEWALSHYGMIPEAVFDLTCASKIDPKELRFPPNPDHPDKVSVCGRSGRISYRKADVFDGFTTSDLPQGSFRIASREKALVDLWFWLPDEWTKARHSEMRWGSLDEINPDLVRAWADAYGTPRLWAAAEAFLALREGWMARGYNWIVDSWKGRGWSPI